MMLSFTSEMLESVNDLISFYGRRVTFMLRVKHSRAEADFQCDILLETRVSWLERVTLCS